MTQIFTAMNESQTSDFCKALGTHLSAVAIVEHTYLPKSQRAIEYAEELILLLWYALEVHPSMCGVLVDSLNVKEYFLPILAFLSHNMQNPQQKGLVYISSRLINIFTVYPGFNENLN